MKMITNIISLNAAALMQKAKLFPKDVKGTSAIEFALIAPLMILSYFGTVEISRTYITQNKVEAISETVSDLVSQGKSITTSQLEDIFKISAKTLTTTEEDKYNIVVTAVRTEPDESGNPKTTVRWSQSKDGTKTHAVDSEYTELPEGLASNYETIIVTELYYSHEAILGMVVKGKKKFDRRFINKPRYSSDIPCSDC